MTSAHIAILLALYDGADHLPAQMASFVAQTHADWSLIVSDDGSTDAGPDQIAAFAAAHPDRAVSCVAGPGQGAVRNVLSLLQTVPDGAAYAALSDQDDVWHADKLARAVAALAPLPPETPALYCGATQVCDADLRPLGLSAHGHRTPSFAHAVVQSIAGGNTMVLNRAAVDLAAQAASRVPDPVVHDWWLYQVVTGHGGTVIYDPVPALDYRQHGQNLIGAKTGVQAVLARMRGLGAAGGGRFQGWMQTNLAALVPLHDGLSPQARATLDAFTAARHGQPWHRLQALHRSGVHRHGRMGTAALYLAALVGRL